MTLGKFKIQRPKCLIPLNGPKVTTRLELLNILKLGCRAMLHTNCINIYFLQTKK